MGKDSVKTERSYRNVVIGAGITGLAAAYYLGEGTLVLESERRPGGAFSSVKEGGYILDLGERFIRIDRRTKGLFEEVFGRDFFCRQNLYAQIDIKGKRYWHPFQYNLYGMDKAKLAYCIAEAVKASQKGRPGRYRNFREWIFTNFGKGIADMFMMPYNRKIWCVDPAKMSADWFFDGSVVPEGDLRRMIDGASMPYEEREGSYPQRYYPKKGGASSVAEYMVGKIRGDFLFDSRVTGIDAAARKVKTERGDVIRYENLVSTMPLNELARMVRPVPAEIKALGASLKYNSVLCTWVGIKGDTAEKCHWLYFPEKKYAFSRLYFPGNFSKDVVPAGRSVIGAITTFCGKRPSPEVHRKKLLKDLAEIGLLKKKDIEFIREDVIKYGFCMPLLGTRKAADTIKYCLERRGIFSIGRYGEWKYSGMEHALMDGKKIAGKLKKGAGGK